MTLDISALLAPVRTDPALAALPAVTFYAGNQLVAHQDWHALVEAVDHFAGTLSQRHGVRPGDAVAVLMPNGTHTPAVYLAVMSLGAVLVPLNPTDSPDDWTFIARDCRAVGVVVADTLRASAAMLEASLPFLCTPADLACEQVRPMEPECGLADRPAVMIYTSGTTGRPKGVVLSHANLLANAHSMAGHFGLHREAQLAVMPLCHAHAFGFGLMTALVSLGHLVLTDRFDPFHWSDIVRAENVRVSSIVPPLLPFLVKVKVSTEAVPSLRALLVSSAPLPMNVARDFVDQTGIALIQGWGLSEFTNFATCMETSGGLPHTRSLLCDHGLPSIGRPLPGVRVEVRDAQGSVLPAGERGELHVSGPSRMLGYHNDGVTVGSTGEWLATGDEGYHLVDDRGPLFFITGRIKDLIIRNADKISPLAVERRILEACPDLAGRIAVVGYPHGIHGEEIGAYIEGPKPDPDVAARWVKAARDLGNGLRPRVLLWGTDLIPRTHTGKVQRLRLRPLFVPYEHYSGPTQLERADRQVQRTLHRQQ